jgi:hypothetical protein
MLQKDNSKADHEDAADVPSFKAVQQAHWQPAEDSPRTISTSLLIKQYCCSCSWFTFTSGPSLCQPLAGQPPVATSNAAATAAAADSRENHGRASHDRSASLVRNRCAAAAAANPQTAWAVLLPLLLLPLLPLLLLPLLLLAQGNPRVSQPLQNCGLGFHPQLLLRLPLLANDMLLLARVPHGWASHCTATSLACSCSLYC